MVVHTATEWDFDELVRGGVAFLRIDFWWHQIEPERDRWDWTHFDNVVRWASSRGIWILAGLFGTPAWAIDPRYLQPVPPWRPRYKPWAYPPVDLTRWTNYVKKVVERYGDRVRYWGIWNEPDSYSEPANVCFWRGTEDEWFRQILLPAIDVIRPLETGHRICVPDLAKANVPAWRATWLRRVLLEAGRKVHAVTVHIYNGAGTGTDVVARSTIARDLIAGYNAKNATKVELWITETGWQNTEHSPEALYDKMRNLCDAVRRSPWIRKVFPYVWSDNQQDTFTFKSGRMTTRRQWDGYKAGIRGA